MDPAQQQAWITDFGQKVDLTARLREILLNYPEGTSILKELVQVTLLTWSITVNKNESHACA
jgi:hypothetical protein